jgi:glycosyltransferase involved in cell wall biosynthesis
MAAANSPLLSIGLPVYNGERFLQFALDSLLNQTFRDFELIICDNASTDATRSICQEYAARDARIRYYRNPENIGAAANFNRVFELARAPYFKWAAADDVISPEFVEKCIAAMQQDPELVLAYTRVDKINSSGEIDGTYDYPMRVNHPSPHVRFADLILVNHFCVAIFGVIRRDVLAQTPLIGKYVGSDRVLLAELGLHGRMVELPEYLFHRRDHPQTSGRMFNIYHRLAWFDPNLRRNINLVNWRMGSEYLRAIRRVPLPSREKLACFRVNARWFIRRRKKLLEDVKAAVIQLAPFAYTIAQRLKKSRKQRIDTGGGI